MIIHDDNDNIILIKDYNFYLTECLYKNILELIMFVITNLGLVLIKPIKLLDFKSIN